MIWRGQQERIAFSFTQTEETSSSIKTPAIQFRLIITRKQSNKAPTSLFNHLSASYAMNSGIQPLSATPIKKAGALRGAGDFEKLLASRLCGISFHC